VRSSKNGNRFFDERCHEAETRRHGDTEKAVLPRVPASQLPRVASRNMSSTLGPGYIHVYTGRGKGKTTASLGLALRAVGRGLRVLVIQFLKGPEATGELKGAERLAPYLEIRPMGRVDVLSPTDVSKQDAGLASQALKESMREMVSSRWDVVVLDEILAACSLDLVTVQDVLKIMEARPEGVELILTGRGAPEEIIQKADLVTEMREVRHYFHKGVKGRVGVER